MPADAGSQLQPPAPPAGEQPSRGKHRHHGLLAVATALVVSGMACWVTAFARYSGAWLAASVVCCLAGGATVGVWALLSRAARGVEVPWVVCVLAAGLTFLFAMVGGAPVPPS